MFTIFPSQISSFLFFTPYPTPNFVVYCCGPVRLRSKHSWSLCPARPVPSSGSPLSSVPFASSPPFFTTLLAFSCEILYCFCFSLVFVVMVLLPSKFEWSHFYHLLSLGVTEPHRSHFAATFVFVILRSVEDTKCSKWKQVVLSNLTLKALLFLCWFSFFLSFLFFFLQMNVHTVGGFAFQLDLLVVIDCAWAQSWVKSGHRMWSEDCTVTDELNHGRIKLPCDWWVTCWDGAIRQGHVIPISQYFGDVISADR